MPVMPEDIVLYGSLMMPEDDTNQVGGGVDLSTQISFTDINPAGLVEFVSDNLSDSGTVIITGRDTAGVVITQGVSLNGTTPVVTQHVLNTVLKVQAMTHSGTLTVRELSGEVLMKLPPSVNQIRRPFFNVAADVPGGVNKLYFEKIFMRNNHLSLALTQAQISKTLDPSGKIEFALEPSLNGTDTTNNRNISPSGYTFDTTSKTIGNHLPQSAQGIWLRLTLNAGDLAQNTFVTLREAGLTV